MRFRRYLSPDALQAAKRLVKPVAAQWLARRGARVHLRPHDEVMFYLLGQKTLTLSCLGTASPKMKNDRERPGGMDALGELSPYQRWLANSL